MAIGGSHLIDRFLERKSFDNACRTKVKQLLNPICNYAVVYKLLFVVSKSCSVCVYKDAHRACYPNCIGQLNQNLICYSCSYQVLGNISCSVGGRPVNFTRIFAGECSSAVSPFPAVCIYDNLSSR